LDFNRLSKSTGAAVLGSSSRPGTLWSENTFCPARGPTATRAQQGKAKQTLFEIVYDEGKLFEVRKHLRGAVRAGGLNPRRSGDAESAAFATFLGHRADDRVNDVAPHDRRRGRWRFLRFSHDASRARRLGFIASQR
jgi:hypothetical protein